MPECDLCDQHWNPMRALELMKKPLMSVTHVSKWHNLCDNNLQYSYYYHWKYTANMHLRVLHMAAWIIKKYYKWKNMNKVKWRWSEWKNKQTNKGIVALWCIPSSSQFIWIMAEKLRQSEAGASEVGYLVQEIQIQQTWEGCVTQPWGKVASQYHWQQGLDPRPAVGFGLMRDLTTASGGGDWKQWAK